METAAVDETVFLGPAEVPAKTGGEIILNTESSIVDEILIQLHKDSQLMTADFADGEIIDPVINGDQATLFHKLCQVIGVLGIEGVVVTVGTDHSGHAPEQTLPGERLFQLFAKGSGQRVGAVDRVVTAGKAVILTGTAFRHIPEPGFVFGLMDITGCVHCNFLLNSCCIPCRCRDRVLCRCSDGLPVSGLRRTWGT